MPRFYIVNENTEDTLGDADQLPAAIQLAREAAQLGQPGALVTIVESQGKAVRQFVRLADGAVIEQPIASRAKPELFAVLNGSALVPAGSLPRS